MELPDKEPEANVLVIDGSALVNSLPPRNANTFGEYAKLDVGPIIQMYSSKYLRIDIVFDVYWSSSLKAEARSKRGIGSRRRVTDKGKIPQNWMSFLRDNNNKTELFIFLADKIVEVCKGNTVIVTREESVVCNKPVQLEGLTSCNHEEADTRMFVHARHATAEGNKVIMIKASDTDVLVIAISVFDMLHALGCERLWIAFGQGRNQRWIPIHEINTAIGLAKTKGILFFNAFTGCDVVSAFRGKAKKTAWQTWDVCPEVSNAFAKLSQYPPVIEVEDQALLEKFVIAMYDRSSTTEAVDEARLDLFARKQRSYDAIPPTQAALIQHTRRATYQAGCIWGQATVCQMEPQSPSDWGGRKKTTFGKPFGQHFLRLLRAVNSLQSVDVKQNVEEGASVIVSVYLVQHYVAATAIISM